jgi:HD-GYP domain-containing protein (c-di-GMP phosphodiesterase class II)
MQQVKEFVIRYFEPVIVLVLVAGTAFAVLVAPDRMAFLNFFYVPAVFAAYFLGVRQGMMVALAAVLMVTIYAIIDLSAFTQTEGHMPGFSLVLWGAFLVVVTYLVGSLYEVKQHAISDLEQAYGGILGMAATLIDAVSKHAEDHSTRVATLAGRIAIVLDLPTDEIDDIYSSALLHDIGRLETSLQALREAAAAESDESRARSRTTSRGLLRNVVDIVETFGESFDGSGPKGLRGDSISRQARVLAAADEYESRIAPKPYGPELSSEAARLELQALSGTRLDPVVVAALMTAVEST